MAGGWAWWLASGIVLALGVAAITGVISYEHGLDVARRTGNTGLVSFLIPLVPDLTIAMSSLVLVVASAIRAPRPWAAVVSLAVGIGWTVAQNVASGWAHGEGDAVLSGGIPVAFVLTVELLMWLVRCVRRARAAANAVPEPGEPIAPAAALELLLGSASQRQLEEMLGVPRSRVRAWAAQVCPADGAGQDEADADAA